MRYEILYVFIVSHIKKYIPYKPILRRRTCGLGSTRLNMLVSLCPCANVCTKFLETELPGQGVPILTETDCPCGSRSPTMAPTGPHQLHSHP